MTILRAGISSAFFRFYFDAKDTAGRLLVLRTSFWFTMASATAGLVAGVLLAEPLADLLLLDDANLVRAAFVGIWAQMNYEQLTALFRVEERSGLFVAASLANIAVTVAATLVLVVSYDQGALGVIVGNFTGTLVVYLALLGYRRAQLGLQLSRPLLREMNRFGIPLVPSALALIALNFGDRFFLNELVGTAEVGRYELGVRIASAMVLLITAFRMAWPAFAYSIEDDDEAKRTYAFVLTYLVAARVVAGARARAALALARAPARDAGVLRGRPGRRAARLRRRRVRGLHRDGDRRRARQADAVQLGDHGRRSRNQRRPQPPARAPVRADRLRNRRRERVHGDVPRDVLVRAAGLPDAVSVAPRRDCGRRRDRADGHRQAPRRAARGGARPDRRVPARPAPARLRAAGRAGAAAIYTARV